LTKVISISRFQRERVKEVKNDEKIDQKNEEKEEN
jgi:hypothetical protein